MKQGLWFCRPKKQHLSIVLNSTLLRDIAIRLIIVTRTKPHREVLVSWHGECQC